MGDVTENRNFIQCPRCQCQNVADNAFCYNCGAPLTASSAEQPPMGFAETQPQQSVQAQDSVNFAETQPAPPVSIPANMFSGSQSGETASMTQKVEKKKKSKKGPIIIAVSVFAVAAAALVVFVGLPAIRAKQLADRYAGAVTLMEQGDFAAAEPEFLAMEDYEDASRQAEICRDNIDYQDAIALMDSGDYAGALAGFEALGSFEDSAPLAEECRNNIDYAEAEALMDAGDYEGAAVIFEQIGDFRSALELADECYNAMDYVSAEEAFDDGRYYDAWQGFIALGDYHDAAARAESCRQPYPDNGETYHNANFSGGASFSVIGGDGRDVPTYLKVYTDGGELVSCIFLYPGESAAITLPSGTYRFKTATGDYWYGDGQMFGDDGYYQNLLFDGEQETFYIDGGSGPYELTLGGVVDGNVGSRSVDPEDF